MTEVPYPTPETTDEERNVPTVDWNEALKENEGWMKSVIARQVGESEGVEEVFQDVALAVARQRSPLRDVAKLGAWLYRLTIFQSAMYRRKTGRRRKLVKGYEERIDPSTGFSDRTEPLDWLLCRERRELVEKSLLQLQPEDRKILLLKYRDDKNYQEIAKELRASVSAVQARLHRARARLREGLAPYVVDSQTNK